MSKLNEENECTIDNCKEQGVQKYQLFKDKPGFLTILCKKHSDEADIELKKKGLKVKPDGSYEVIEQ